MAKLSEIIKFLDGELELKQYDDHSLNGLQVEGESEITSIAVSVDAGESVIEDAKSGH